MKMSLEPRSKLGLLFDCFDSDRSPLAIATSTADNSGSSSAILLWETAALRLQNRTWYSQIGCML